MNGTWKRMEVIRDRPKKKKKKNQIERYKECKTDKAGGLEFER